MVTPTSNSQTSSELRPAGCLLRLFWMGIGNAALIYAAVHLALAADTVQANLIFFGIAIALLGARALDVLRFEGMTTDNRRATAADLRRYAIGWFVLVSAAWLLANSARSA